MAGPFDDLIKKYSPTGGAVPGGPGPGGTGAATRTTPAPRLTNPDKVVLNDLNKDAVAGSEIVTLYDRGAKAVDRLGTGPFRGAFLEAAIPDEKGGILDKIGSTVVGGTAKMFGALPNRDVVDYQTIKALQAEGVLARQLPQKGPQTDSDAARMQLAELSPYKRKEVNKEVDTAGRAKATRAAKRAPFYTNWAAKYGLNAPDEQGRSVEQAYQQSLASQSGISVRRIK